MATSPFFLRHELSQIITSAPAFMATGYATCAFTESTCIAAKLPIIASLVYCSNPKLSVVVCIYVSAGSDATNPVGFMRIYAFGDITYMRIVSQHITPNY
jgi:hypothetical protein